jgi:long-chain acyl-CoA synthetase
MTPVTAAGLEESVERMAQTLRRVRPRVLGLLADNGPAWLVADLAAERAGVPLVPLPAFFTQQQMAHAVAATGMDALITQSPQAALALGFRQGEHWYTREAEPVALPQGTAKITFTSGTTGTPKGVYLGAEQQRALAEALVAATRDLGLERHLCLLPLAVLLENVAGARATLLSGAACVIPPLREVGIGGATEFDPVACLTALERAQAHSAILLPQMLLALTLALEAGAPRPAQLRFAAVGGAKVSPALIARARAAGLPAYEGYGLSECASVVALNLPGADRPGSVGRPLAHARVKIAPDGEIIVGGKAQGAQWISTGDLGRLDADGFLHVEGRRKHLLITSFGRNVAPEWPEAELTAGGTLAQAAVFGEARPRLCAVVVPRRAHATDAEIDAEVRRANARLPDYARIAFWVRAAAPFSAADGSATPNGRVRRDAVWARYGERLDSRHASPSGAPAHAVL